jgi:type VI protein secretion system component VasK
MKILIALFAVLLIAVAVFTSVADAQLWRWMMKALMLIGAVVTVVALAGYWMDAAVTRAERDSLQDVDMSAGGWYVHPRGHKARLQEPSKADNQPDPELIQSLLNTWKNEGENN